MKTTRHLEWIMEHYQWFPNDVLQKHKRELDRRYRKRRIKEQQQRAKQEYEKNIQKN
jgi:hypothetical protein